MPTTPSLNTIKRIARGVLLAGFIAFLPGCQIWNAWLDMLKWKEAPVAGAGGGGSLPVIRPISDLNPPNALIPRVAVYRLTLPVGAFSSNDKIWSQLNEDAVDSKTAVLMAQNGLRAGIGTVARFPNILKTLDLPDPNIEERLYQTDGHSSINVLTRPGVDYQIVFSVDQDQQLKGREYYSCDNGFRLTMVGVRGKPQLQVQLEPVVTLGTVTVLRGPNTLGVTRSGFTSEESFTDLRMATLLTADQFLVVCAMDPKGSEHSVGTLWLSNQGSAPATETVLVFVPATGSPAPAAAAK